MTAAEFSNLVFWGLWIPFDVIVCLVFARDFWRWWRAEFPPVPADSLDKYFETFKHLSTLNVATAGFFLAVYGKEAQEIVIVKAAVVLLAVSMVAAMGGIHTVLASEDAKRRLEVLYGISFTLLGGGLLLFVGRYLGGG